MTPPFLRSRALDAPDIRHGFFGRAGGVSTGIFASLNCGLGSEDARANARENRARAAAALGVAPDRLVTLHQVHSPRAIIVDAPPEGDRPQADGMATKTKGLALGVLAADCMPVLFADADAGVIGAAHAGWRGALAGVLEATVAAMVTLGADPARIAAALGPCLRPPHFQVGEDLIAAFLNRYSEADRFFSEDPEPHRRQIDLAAFARWRLRSVGVTHFDDLGISTLAAPDAYFSYRASRQAGEADYGRNLSAIALQEF